MLQAYENGKTTMSIHERKASLREFYGVIFPSLLQLHRGITDVEERKQREICAKYRKKDEMDKGKLCELDLEREEECGICMEINTKVVLPKCSHSMCMKCYRSWRARSQSCPFCRDSLKRVNSGDLWIYTCNTDTVELPSITQENSKRLYMYIEKLPLIAPNPMLVSCDPHLP
uniref:RING-type domain-containing protein n=1 Tax=Rhizophora mucronata TaxID=61149 RepID=A0A2P2JKV7_RHIMU